MIYPVAHPFSLFSRWDNHFLHSDDRNITFYSKMDFFLQRVRTSYHFLATQATDFLAASSRSTAEVMGSPLLLRMFWASWTLVPRRWGVQGEQSLKWNWRWCPGKFPKTGNCAMPRSHEHNLITTQFQLFRIQIWLFRYVQMINLFSSLFTSNVWHYKDATYIFSCI